jgi:hypothetical protein
MIYQLAAFFEGCANLSTATLILSMYPYLSQNIPVVFIANTAECFFEYIHREQDPENQVALIHEMQTLGDRALLFPCRKKLAIITHAIAHDTLIREYYGFTETSYLSPKDPSAFLCLDILREPELIEAIAQYAQPLQQVYLIPHSTTPQFLALAQTLREKYKIDVILPESPSNPCLWLRDFVDTKSGFHQLISSWINTENCQLPLSIPCRDREHAADVAFWFLNQQRDCIVKADKGNDALGHTILKVENAESIEIIRKLLNDNYFLDEDIIIVEEFIEVCDQLFPSIELFVPPLNEANPYVTYLCNQAFSEAGRFIGLLIDRELYQEQWYLPLFTTAMTIANCLQKMGYVGHFDIDTIIDSQGKVYLLEINARRTGGTHVHETANFIFGKNYLENYVLLSDTAMNTGGITGLSTLVKRLKSILYPMKVTQDKGVILTHSSGLSVQKFGFIIAESSKQAALALQQIMVELLGEY